MTILQGFAPVSRSDARILILGSMPGRKSLTEQQYYAHPRNLFWPLMADILGFDPSLAYAERLQQLRAHGIALWDVARLCERASSLDSDIVDSTVVVNDFNAFFISHPHIERVCLNGNKAATLYRRHVQGLTKQAQAPEGLSVRVLPSTSPANASISRVVKHAAWSDALSPLRRAGPDLR